MANPHRYTIQEIKQINQNTGHYFFERSTMRFFGNTMKDFRVRHVDTHQGTDIYVIARNHNAPEGVSMISIYKFDPESGDIRRVNLSQNDFTFLRRHRIPYAAFEAMKQGTTARIAEYFAS